MLEPLARMGCDSNRAFDELLRKPIQWVRLREAWETHIPWPASRADP